MSGPRFSFAHGSKFLNKSEPQEAMMDVIRSGEESGILVSPCGSGKSAVIIEALMDAGTLGIIFCYESQGVYQMAEAIRQNTNLSDCQIITYNGRDKKLPSRNCKRCIFITTYGMFASERKQGNEASAEARDFVFNTPWDLVCCDEVHHVCAKTYYPMILKLQKTAKRILGFTATLYRSELKSNELTSAECEEKAFGWFGPVLFRRKSKELEEVGLIAKIRRARICVDFTREYALAYKSATGAQHNYLAALNPTKLNALKSLCAAHKACGHVGIVFANHLLVAQVVSEILGDGWEELSGGTAYGRDESPKTAEKNNKIVERFNAGELDGMVCTAVGESCMDVHYHKFCYVCVVDADGGHAATAQRVGRAARSDRINLEDGEDEEELTARRVANQKNAYYYDLVTDCPTERLAEESRERLLNLEGYRDVENVPVDVVVGMAREAGVPLPYTTQLEEMHLLKRVLTYNTLRDVCTVASEAAAASQQPQRAKVKDNQARVQLAKNAISKDLANRKLSQSKQNLKATVAEDKLQKQRAIAERSMDSATRNIFASLNLPARTLSELGIAAGATMMPSDDDSDDDGE